MRALSTVTLPATRTAWMSGASSWAVVSAGVTAGAGDGGMPDCARTGLANARPIQSSARLWARSDRIGRRRGRLGSGHEVERVFIAGDGHPRSRGELTAKDEL